MCDCQKIPAIIFFHVQWNVAIDTVATTGTFNIRWLQSAPQQPAGHLKWDKGVNRSPALAIHLFTARFYLWVLWVTFFLLSTTLLLWLQVKMSYQVSASVPIVPSGCRLSHWKAAADHLPNITSTWNNWSTSVRPVLGVHFQNGQWCSRWVSECHNTNTQHEPQTRHVTAALTTQATPSDKTFDTTWHRRERESLLPVGIKSLSGMKSLYP